MHAVRYITLIAERGLSMSRVRLFRVISETGKTQIGAQLISSLQSRISRSDLEFRGLPWSAQVSQVLSHLNLTQ
jgi:hypothetical protein